MTKLRLRHAKGKIIDDSIIVKGIQFKSEDVMKMARACFSEWPLIDEARDARIKLIKSVQTSVIKEEPGGKRWIVLDALRLFTRKRNRRL